MCLVCTGGMYLSDSDLADGLGGDCRSFDDNTLCAKYIT